VVVDPTVDLHLATVMTADTIDRHRSVIILRRHVMVVDQTILPHLRMTTTATAITLHRRITTILLRHIIMINTFVVGLRGLLDRLLAVVVLGVLVEEEEEEAVLELARQAESVATKVLQESVCSCVMSLRIL
jgi:hypothetical protein